MSDTSTKGPLAMTTDMGWVMVPREPTEAMIDAARHFLEPATERIGRAAWAAMLASLPGHGQEHAPPTGAPINNHTKETRS